MTFLSDLTCSKTGGSFPADRVQNLSPAGAPLLARYDLARARQELTKEVIARGPNSMWRYAPLLPVADPRYVVSLGEGNTPILFAERLGARLGANNLLIKDEGVNPTGTFKARGMACAVSMAKELGVKRLAAPSAGNAGGALAAYAAAAGMEAHIFMPRDVPEANYIECKMYGAHVTLVDGLISDCGRIVAERKDADGWFEVSTLKEPYRIEGKKTMGLELAEQLGWRLPDAMFYPTGGGVGIIGMWKAFHELEQLGWIGAKRPKMIAVQSTGCAPIVKAFEQGKDASEFWEGASTLASGLRVPKALGDFLVLQAVRESGGTCIAVSDEHILRAGRLLAETEGIFAAPEGAACIAALEPLLAGGFLKGTDEIVIWNTGTGLKYLDNWQTQFPYQHAASERQGGLILPR
jgi:threonine synthase